MAQFIPAHLETVDPEMWPSVALCTVPGPLIDARARAAESHFAKACLKAGIDLDGSSPDIRVLHEELFVRLAERGWIGLAESFMAGEWESDQLVSVLSGLLASGYKPMGVGMRRSGKGSQLAPDSDLPVDLIQLYSADGVSGFGAMFASGVPTTERVAKPSYVRGAGRGAEPKTHFVDITWIAPPGPVEREDLNAAQHRAGESLLELARVAHGSDVLELPSSGGAVAVLAAQRGASVDILGSDEDHLVAVSEYIGLNRAQNRASVHVLDRAIPGPHDWGGRYDAVVSVEKLETMPDGARIQFAKSCDRFLDIGGFMAMQTLVTTPKFGKVASSAAEVIREYVWPGMRYPTIDELHKLFDRETGLRITGEIHFGGHYLHTLRLQREIFEGKLREAAAAGFDPVFRRLWIFRFALLEAMFQLGMLDAVQLRLTGRSRGGRR